MNYRLERLLFNLKRNQTPFLALFRQKRKEKKMTNFWPKPWTNPFGKMQIVRLSYRCFHRLERLLFILNVTKHLFSAYFAKSEKKKKFRIFDQNHGLAPLGKCKFCDFLKSMFIWSWEASSLFTTSQNTFSGPIWPKIEKKKKWQIFDQNHGLTSLEKCDFLKSIFFVLERLLFNRNVTKHLYLPFFL